MNYAHTKFMIRQMGHNLHPPPSPPPPPHKKQEHNKYVLYKNDNI